MPRLFDANQAPGDDVEPRRQEPVFAPAAVVDIDLPARKSPQREFEPSDQRVVEPAVKQKGFRGDAPQVPVSNTILDLPMNGATARREPKITIGQIDVQVINTPAPAPVASSPSSAADSKGYMSAELDRFRWRLR
jgi:hypothetical protein